MRIPARSTLLVAVALATTACGGGTADPAATTAPTTSETTTASSPTPASSPSPTATPSPASTVGGPDCSTQGAAVDVDLDALPRATRDTATFLLDAASRCDEPLLATAATESETTLSFGVADPYEVFALPEGDERYVALVTLLTEVPWAAQADDADPATFVWPRVATQEWQDDDAAWQEVVDAGVLTADEASSQRDAGSGYLGWRIGITGDGTWTFFVAGD